MIDLMPDEGGKGICDERLWAFIQGHVDPAEAIVIATHCCLCGDAATRLKQLMRCAAAVMETHTETKMKCSGAEFFAERCLSSAPIADQVLTEVTHNVPKPLQGLCGSDFDAVDWIENAFGYHEKHLHVENSTLSLGLYKMPAGFQVPEHSHLSNEIGMVIRGSLLDGDTLYKAGDVRICRVDSPHDRHAPRALEDCICLIVYG